MLLALCSVLCALCSVLNLPAYKICNNSELVTLEKERPDSVDKLVSIKGFGDQKIVKFGEEIVAYLNSI